MNAWALCLSFLSSLSVPGCNAKNCAEQAPKAHENAKVVVLMATDRPGSNTSTVADNLVAAYQNAGVSAQFFNITDFGPEFYAPTAYAQKPAAFTQFNDAVLAADVVVLVTPEYNATIPAPLTRVINLLSFPDSFKDKKYIIVSLSISPYAASRAYDGLKKVLTDLHAVVQDDLNLKVPEAQNVTKGANMYAEHAAHVAEVLQK